MYYQNSSILKRKIRYVHSVNIFIKKAPFVSQRDGPEIL